MKSGPAHVNCIKWNSSGSRCLTGGSDGVLRLFDLQQKDCVAQWQAQQGEIHTVDVSMMECHCSVRILSGPLVDESWLTPTILCNYRWRSSVFCELFKFYYHLPALSAASSFYSSASSVAMFPFPVLPFFLALCSYSHRPYSSTNLQFTKDERGCYSMGAGGSSSITQWTLDGAKTAELSLHSGAGGPFVLSGFGGLKQVSSSLHEVFLSLVSIERTIELMCVVVYSSNSRFTRQKEVCSR